MSDKEQYILSHHVQTYMYILHSPTPLFITLCCMYVFLHLSGEEHTGCHSRQEEAVSLWGDRNWSGAHCGSLYHHEPRICWQDRTARESQSSLQVRQTIVRLLYIWPPPLCCIQSHRLSIFLPPPCPFSLLSHSPFHPSTPPPLFSTLLHHPPTSSTLLHHVQTLCYGGARLWANSRNHAGRWGVPGGQAACQEVSHTLHTLQGTVCVQSFLCQKNAA